MSAAKPGNEIEDEAVDLRSAILFFALAVVGICCLFAYARFLEPVREDLNSLNGEDAGKLVLVSGRAASVSFSKGAAFITLCSSACVGVFVPKETVEEMRASSLDLNSLEKNKRLLVEGIVREDAGGIEITVIEPHAIDVMN